MLSVITDRKLPADDGVYNTSGAKANSTPDGLVDYFKADLVSATDYYAFGSPMPSRQSSSNFYRYGFNGKENDNEVKGTGNSVDFGARIYDPRIGRWLTTDPQALNILIFLLILPLEITLMYSSIQVEKL